eukprot:XP_017167953.1 PREDICTED: carcinoembryonic antigen-related cell adhesion molecule 2-like [Mus musculus]
MPDAGSATSFQPVGYSEKTYLWRINGYSLSAGYRLKLSEGSRTFTYSCPRRHTWLCSGCNNGSDVLLISPSDIHFYPESNLNLSCHATSYPLAH